MKTLPFITELVEARMFYGPKDLKNMSADKIAEIVFLIFMMIEVVRHYKPGYASTYASDTLKYNTYENMHYAGTDLGNLLAVLNNQDTFKAYIKTESGVAIPLFQINRYLRDVISNSKSNHSDDVTFFWRLEDYLKLYSNSLLRQLRRDIGNWNDLSLSNKEQIYLILRREFDKRSSSVDIYLWYKSSFKITKNISEAKLYTELLTELSDSPYKFQTYPKFSHNELKFYQFRTNSGKLYVVASERFTHNNERAIKVDFGLYAGGDEEENISLGTDFTSGIEGVGDAIRVFSTVKAIIDLELSMRPKSGNIRPVMYIELQGKSDDSSRIKLYGRFARNAGKYFPGFELQHTGSSRSAEGEILTTWWLKRNEDSLYSESTSLQNTSSGAILNGLRNDTIFEKED